MYPRNLFLAVLAAALFINMMGCGGVPNIFNITNVNYYGDDDDSAADNDGGLVDVIVMETEIETEYLGPDPGTHIVAGECGTVASIRYGAINGDVVFLEHRFEIDVDGISDNPFSSVTFSVNGEVRHEMTNIPVPNPTGSAYVFAGPFTVLADTSVVGTYAACVRDDIAFDVNVGSVQALLDYTRFDVRNSNDELLEMDDSFEYAHKVWVEQVKEEMPTELTITPIAYTGGNLMIGGCTQLVQYLEMCAVGGDVTVVRHGIEMLVWGDDSAPFEYVDTIVDGTVAERYWGNPSTYTYDGPIWIANGDCARVAYEVCINPNTSLEVGDSVQTVFRADVLDARDENGGGVIPSPMTSIYSPIAEVVY